ncbi:MAG: acyl carrier protein [Candidatus Rickettsiella isopodorum]|nr:acyl carrier protein [Flavobacterium sp.]
MENEILNQLRELSLYERKQVLTHYLKHCAAPYLHINLEEFPLDESFFDLGLTSLKAVEIKYILEKDLKIKLCSTILFDHPTINKLGEFIQCQKLKDLFENTSKDKKNDLISETEKLGKEVLDQYFNL